MPSPFDFMSESRESHEEIIIRLDNIEAKLKILVQLLEKQEVDWYGDGK